MLPNLTLNEGIVYDNLLEARDDDDGAWAEVYLYNALPDGMPVATFRSILSSLSKKGLYRVIDNNAWGMVKL